MLSTNEKVIMNVQDLNVTNSKSEKLLDITIDSNLSFKSYVNKVSSKIHALARVAPYMNIRQRRMTMNAFFNSQPGCCPLIWMHYGRMANNKINKLHESCLRIIYSNKSFSDEELLEKDSSVSQHHRNLRILATEMFNFFLKKKPWINERSFSFLFPKQYQF